ncbi:MAG: nucleotidyltransferase [Verrucomicrobiales bacterium]|nr:nucleotidyltransferase [Verrucomicrobiales bacterium]
MQNLSKLVERLISAQVEFVLVGGFAAVAHGVTLVTRDVDICCSFTEPNLLRIQKAFADLHPVHRSRPDLPSELTLQQCATLKNLYLKTDWGIVDCLSEVLGIGGFDEVLKASVELDLPAGKCHVIDIDALIRAKEAMNRDHDRITVRHLQEIKKKLG